MHFLLVNDDGFDSPELRLLCRAAADRGHRVTVVAPREQQSGKSHSFTIFEPLLAERMEMEGAAAAWRVAGTPVDCARLGMMSLTDQPIDLVISGINQGYNIGLATYVSGTVGAAREASFLLGRSLAVSVEARAPQEMRRFVADYAIRTAEHLVHADVPPQSICNLNAPGRTVDQLRGVRVCPLCKAVYLDSYVRYEAPRGQLSFWLGPMVEDLGEKPGTDLALLKENWMTVTFLTPEPIDQSAWVDFPLEL